MKVLCVNAGSSSLKFQLYDMPAEISIIGGYVEKIGAKDSFYTIKHEGKKNEVKKLIADHTEAVKIMLEELINYGVVKDLSEIKAVGHRAVHGGEKYTKSVVINDEVLKDMKEFGKFAPLHLPGNIAGVKAMQKALPDAVQVAVFDTAFHHTIPKIQYMYPVPMEWYEKYGVRKYGFHGTSHKYITETMQKKLGKENINLIICHVGSGASITAVKDGKSYDTTMGLTPLDGLMMGTRSGSIDPSIIKYMVDEAGMTYDKVDDALNKKSGLLGVCGFNDNRDVEEAISKGDENARLALDMYVDRIDRYIAEYYLELGGEVDAIVFTAGVLENGAETRESIIRGLAPLGIKINKEVNDAIASFKEITSGVITAEDSTVPVYVEPTNEELMIVRDAYKLAR
ncbi:MAG: acetate kinase [Candidatus Saccharibacteria bacterium]|nr:acetate kinase [Candidatus Saccharibacteria bacterium]